MGEFQSAQYALSPVLLYYFNWSKYHYIILKCTNPTDAKIKAEEFHATIITDLGNGIALIRRDT